MCFDSMQNIKLKVRGGGKELSRITIVFHIRCNFMQVSLANVYLEFFIYKTSNQTSTARSCFKIQSMSSLLTALFHIGRI